MGKQQEDSTQQGFCQPGLRLTKKMQGRYFLP